MHKRHQYMESAHTPRLTQYLDCRHGRFWLHWKRCRPWRKTISIEHTTKQSAYLQFSRRHWLACLSQAGPCLPPCSCSWSLCSQDQVFLGAKGFCLIDGRSKRPPAYCELIPWGMSPRGAWGTACREGILARTLPRKTLRDSHTSPHWLRTIGKLAVSQMGQSSRGI